MKLQSDMGLKWFESAVFKAGLRKEQGFCSAGSGSGSGIAGPKDHERHLWGKILALGYLTPTVFTMVMCLCSPSSCRFKGTFQKKAGFTLSQK